MKNDQQIIDSILKEAAIGKIYYATWGPGDIGKGQQFMKHIQGYAYNIYGNKVQGQLEVHLDVEHQHLSDVKRLVKKFDGTLRSESGKKITARNRKMDAMNEKEAEDILKKENIKWDHKGKSPFGSNMIYKEKGYYGKTVANFDSNASTLIIMGV
jgi:hypothetical protein